MTERNPFGPARPARRGRWWLLAAGVVAVLAVVSLVLTLNNAPHPDIPCAPCVIGDGGQQVGVTDGSFVFDPALGTVEGDIRQADQRLARGKYVTVAFLGPLTPSPDVSIGRIRSWLEGAYIAQQVVNRSGAGLQIRLVLANIGSGENQYRPVVRQLDRMTTGPDPLVAVTGMGISVPQTLSTARLLSQHGIPLVGAVITGDGLSQVSVPGLFRVNPDVRDEVGALAHYLRGAGLGDRAMLIQDNAPGDLYTASLNADFRTGLAGDIQAGGFPEEPFNAPPNSGALGAQFSALSGNLCGRNPPDMILYAGRVDDLPDFIHHLWARGVDCEPRRLITVVTGSDASSLQGQLKPAPGTPRCGSSTRPWPTRPNSPRGPTAGTTGTSGRRSTPPSPRASPQPTSATAGRSCRTTRWSPPTRPSSRSALRRGRSRPGTCGGNWAICRPATPCPGRPATSGSTRWPATRPGATSRCSSSPRAAG